LASAHGEDDQTGRSNSKPFIDKNSVTLLAFDNAVCKYNSSKTTPNGAQGDSPGHRPDLYPHLMIAGPPSKCDCVAERRLKPADPIRGRLIKRRAATQ
jgi:hypothetical protein